MALPKIFVSSTYYDLMHIRNDIETFIKNLGYEPILHERNNVTYTQIDTLEDSCYREIENCEILVCIIGNKFGTESNSNNYSITMNELQTAMTQQKKIYAFIQKDVSVENRVYLKNKDNTQFVPAVVDNIKIHDFIANLKNTVKNFPITEFESVNDIIKSLRSQFAGLFQNLLQREMTLTESKTFYDLNSVSDKMNGMIDSMTSTNQEVLTMLSSTLFVTHEITQKLMDILSISDFRVLIHNKNGMIRFIESVGFKEEKDPFQPGYQRTLQTTKQYLKISENIFDENENLIRYPDRETVNNAFEFHISKIQEDTGTVDIDDDDLPF